MKQLVSVVIPIYKNVNFLKDSLGSVINQDYKNLETIVVNDGSPEKSKIINIINKNFKKIK